MSRVPCYGPVLLLAACCCAACGLPTVRAGDWTSWRGPNRDGISTETNLLTEWSDDGPPLKWKVSELGQGYASISVSDGRIFTMGKLGRGASLIALDLKSGEKLWERKVGGGNPNCTPTVDGGMVYALGREGDLLCADAESGDEVWRINFKTDLGGKMMSHWGYSESPLIDGERLICTPGGTDAAIAALDKRTGKVIWTAAQPADIGSRGGDGAGYSSIVISEACGTRQYVQLVGRGLIAVRADDGQVLWSYNRIANGTANVPTPIIDGDYVFCSTGYGTGAALLHLTSTGNGIKAEEVYFLDGKTMQNHHGGMVKIGDYIYCGHGNNNGFPLCIEMMTGEIAWRSKRGAGGGSAAVLHADGHLYFRYQDGVMALIETTPDEYILKGSFKAASNNGRAWPHPVIVDGDLFLRDQDALLCYRIAR